MATTITWPAALPAPKLPLQREPVDLKRATKVLSGRTRQAPSFDEGPVIVNATFAMTGLQFAIFQSYWAYTLEQGSALFLMTLPTGYGTAEHECQFLGTYRDNQTGQNRWEVNVRMQLERQPVLDQAVAETLAAYNPPEAYGEFINRLRIFVRDDIPATLGDLT